MLSKWMLPGTLALFVCGSALATPPVARVAVIIGNNEGDTTLEQLRYADDDAVLYAELLAPFSDRVELLAVLDSDTQLRHPEAASRSRPPNRAELRMALDAVFSDIAVAKRAGLRTELLFIYSGHGGLDDEGKGHLFLGQEKLTRADLFHDIVAASPADFTHLIIDACNAYSLVAGRGEQEDAAQMRAERAVSAFLGGHDLADYPTVGALVATSDERETHEWSRVRAGVFSHLVRAALAGAGDVNNDGRVEYSEAAAFIDAASGNLATMGKRLTTFAWAPRQDQRAPLLSLRHGATVRHLVLGPEVTGKLYVEDPTGSRWAEFHKAQGAWLVLVLQAGTDYFLRNDSAEVEIAGGDAPVLISAAPSEPHGLQHRGALDRAFETGLFSVPFGPAFYHGFVSGRSTLVPVRTVEERFLPGVEIDSPSRWKIDLGYVVAPTLFWNDEVEQGISLRLGRVLSERLDLGVELEGAFASHPHPNADGLFRVAIMPSVGLRLALSRRWQATSNLAVGYAVVGVTGERSSTDWGVGVARMRVGLGAELVADIWLSLSGGWAAYLLTVNGARELRSRPVALVTLGWQE